MKTQERGEKPELLYVVRLFFFFFPPLLDYQVSIELARLHSSSSSYIYV